MRLRIGTRGSRLAIVQAEWVAARLRAGQPDLEVELVRIRTSGDRITDRPLADIGGKGLFAKEIEQALIDERVDCAVHSMKDLPGELTPGLDIAAIPERAAAHDVLVTRDGSALDDLPRGARVGTSSPRRAALVLCLRRDLEVLPFRGNVETRLRKLRDGQVEATLLAAAGLARLELAIDHRYDLDPLELVPAIGQGALAIQCRPEHTERLAVLDDPSSRTAVTAERGFLVRCGGSCVTPLAAYAQTDGERVHLHAVIAAPDGSRSLRGEESGAAEHAAEIGTALAERLLVQGGEEILRATGAR